MEGQQIQILFFEVSWWKDGMNLVPNLVETLVIIVFHFDLQNEALRKFVLQMLSRPKALELSGHHDGDSRTQRFALLHAVRCQNHGLAGVPRLVNDCPKLAFRVRIDAGGRLVEENQVGITDQ